MFKTVLVAIDSSDLSAQVIQTLTTTIQLQPDTKVVLARVIPPPKSDLERPADQPDIDPEVASYRYIEKQLEAHQAHLSCESEIEIVTGDPAEEIVRLAYIHRAALIVIGSRGLTGVKRILEQSVSSQVVADAPCSVLVVKLSD